ncbi:MAG TPA: Holliday junction branch migration protein RuvA [Clostridiales bacterium]|nr:Holliday junction branch migration protein RuvA [Clostridiales bacterium]
MFYYIKGNLEKVAEDHVIIDQNGIGYKVYTSSFSMEELKHQEEVKVYTELVLREDSVSIYGFSTLQELELFRMLKSVTGVGAKVALGILSSISINELVDIISAGDTAGLMKAQGVGKKIAQRILLELKDKISLLDFDMVVDIPVSSENQTDSSISVFREAVEGLIALGYSEAEATMAVRKAEGAFTELEEIIRAALKHLAK